MQDNNPSKIPDNKLPESPDPVIRSLAGAIPFVGTAIGELLTYRLTKVKEERIAEAFNRISYLVTKLGEEKIDKAYVNSEEYQH